MRPRHILVVEDESGLRELIANILLLDHHEVDTVRDGAEALYRIERRTYDLIISDFRMPELDGVGLYREIKQRQPELVSRFLFVSGTGHEPEYQRFLAENAVPILTKPFSLANLQRLTREVLSAHGPEPERT